MWLCFHFRKKYILGAISLSKMSRMDKQMEAMLSIPAVRKEGLRHVKKAELCWKCMRVCTYKLIWYTSNTRRTETALVAAVKFVKLAEISFYFLCGRKPIKILPRKCRKHLSHTSLIYLHPEKMNISAAEIKQMQSDYVHCYSHLRFGHLYPAKRHFIN